MMGRRKSNRTRFIGIRLTPGEYAKLEQQWKASTCRKLSDYMRRVLFEKQVITFYRNRSLDDLVAEMTKLRKELNHIGNNFNQAVKRLHTLDRINEFKIWLNAWKVEKITLFNKIDEIKKQIQKIAKSWLQ